MKVVWPHLARFRDRLTRHEGSLVRPASVAGAHAKEYLAQLAKEGAVDKATWGWYYVPSRKPPQTPFEFLAQDRNFKVLTGQTAASFWNADFIHREIVTVTVDDPSYARALKAFAASRGWKVSVERDPKARKIPAKKVGALFVEEREATIVDCFRRWAFMDAVATLSRKTPVERLRRQSSWVRISGTDTRVGQALEYAAHQLFNVGHDVTIRDDFVRRQLDEAIEKVREFG